MTGRPTEPRAAGRAVVTSPAPAPATGSHAHVLPPCYLEPGAPEHPLDLHLQSTLGKLVGGASPIALSLAFQDWYLHLALSPGKQEQLAHLLWRQAEAWNPATSSLPSKAGEAVEAPTPDKRDQRFSDAGWQAWPFDIMARSFMQTQEFWEQATSGIRGVEPHHGKVVNFIARQMLDVLSPSNNPWTNPEVLRAAADSGGQNFVQGWRNLLEDMRKRAAALAGAHPAGADRPFVVGRDVAVTPGKVVYRNHLIELIQYAPQTPTVFREPLLIVPSWIMKYYILDLSPHNSLVRYLVGEGHTVFMISWRNPTAADRDLGMDDYLRHGVLDALRTVADICGGVPVHAAGYCLGGTLLAAAAALLGGGRYRAPLALQTLTLLAAQTDFSDPGELGLFIDHSELAFLDAQMWEKGYLDGPQMARSFQLLNSRDLIWSRIMSEYLLGRRTKPSDLMAWNGDSTRLPYRMHSEYLRHLYLHNDLAEGRYCVDGRVVALVDIKPPMFVVATERDHVSPWRSVYKINLLADTEIDFVLASGGHNAGIVSEPGHPRRSYKHGAHAGLGAAYQTPDDWLHSAAEVPGSWWPHWHDWLRAHASGEMVEPPKLGSSVDLGDAPGTYVLAV